MLLLGLNPHFPPVWPRHPFPSLNSAVPHRLPVPTSPSSSAPASPGFGRLAGGWRPGRGAPGRAARGALAPPGRGAAGGDPGAGLATSLGTASTGGTGSLPDARQPVNRRGIACSGAHAESFGQNLSAGYGLEGLLTPPASVPGDPGPHGGAGRGGAGRPAPSRPAPARQVSRERPPAARRHILSVPRGGRRHRSRGGEGAAGRPAGPGECAGGGGGAERRLGRAAAPPPRPPRSGAPGRPPPPEGGGGAVRGSVWREAGPGEGAAEARPGRGGDAAPGPRPASPGSWVDFSAGSPPGPAGAASQGGAGNGAPATGRWEQRWLRGPGGSGGQTRRHPPTPPPRGRGGAPRDGAQRERGLRRAAAPAGTWGPGERRGRGGRCGPVPSRRELPFLLRACEEEAELGLRTGGRGRVVSAVNDSLLSFPASAACRLEEEGVC